MTIFTTVSAEPSKVCESLLSSAQIKHEDKNSPHKSHYLALPSAWANYFDSTEADETPRKPLTMALDYYKTNGIDSGYAVDIGAGTGRDTLYLLANGWKVRAIDFAPKAIEIIKKRALEKKLPIPETEVSDFVHMYLPEQIDLITSYLAIPFERPEQFLSIWNKIMQHLRPGGIFAGSLLGRQDDFSAISTITVLSEQQIKCLLEPYEILYLQEIKPDLPTDNNKQKHWDIWEFVIRKH